MNVPVARLIVAAFALLLGSCATQRGAPSQDGPGTLDRILLSPHRSPTNRARDRHRHPAQTLQFFGLRPDMTVVEVWPGSGWYTEILAPYLREQGRLYVAHMDPQSSEYARTIVEAFRDKLTARPDLYDKVILTTLAAPPQPSQLAEPGTADLVLTFRNLHNWMMFGWEREALQAMHAALKPGGILGVVEHRGPDGRPQDPKALSGYVSERHAIELIESVGFRLVARSQINANPLDTKDYEKGVWALPPSFAAGASERGRYEAIGESDRSTLKFIKTQSPQVNQ
jgi:predicted methyltransferase